MKAGRLLPPDPGHEAARQAGRDNRRGRSCLPPGDRPADADGEGHRTEKPTQQKNANHLVRTQPAASRAKVVSYQHTPPACAFLPHGKAIIPFNRYPDGAARAGGPRPILCPHVRSSHDQRRRRSGAAAACLRGRVGGTCSGAGEKSSIVRPNGRLVRWPLQCRGPSANQGTWLFARPRAATAKPTSANGPDGTTAVLFFGCLSSSI
jgi:hypothetical protein